MNPTSTSIAVAVAALLGACPGVASAQYAAPVLIQSSDTEAPGTQHVYEYALALPGFVDVTFISTGESPAREVTFDVQQNGKTIDRITDAGTFSRGVAIHHRFARNAASRDSEIVVTAVRYADGTTWTR
jgi:hypothetical protein